MGCGGSKDGGGSSGQASGGGGPTKLDSLFTADAEEINIRDDPQRKRIAADPSNSKYFTEDDSGKLMLSSLPPSITQCTKLKKLYIADHSFTTIPKEICALSNLEELEMSGGSLTEINPEITQLADLQVLLLYGNKITAVPAHIGQLTKLTELNLFNNKIKKIAAEINDLASLEILNLANGAFLQLPALDKLVNLTTLSFHWGKVGFIHGSWATLTKLEEIMANTNRLQTLPELPASVKALDINDNMTNDPSFIKNCVCLEDLMFNKNSWTEIPGTVFNPALKTLKCADNKITAIPDTIGVCAELLAVFASGNEIAALPESVLKCEKMTRADFSKNKLTAGDPTCKSLCSMVEKNGGKFWPL